jgi:hypothetical protein
MRTFTILALIAASPFLARTASGQAFGGQNVQEYSDLAIVLEELPFLNLNSALINATLKQIPLTELIGDDVDADSFSHFHAYFQYEESDQPNQLGRPAHLLFRYQSELSDVDARAIWQRLLEKLNERLSRTVERLEEHSRHQQEDLQARLRAQLEEEEENLQRTTQLHIGSQVENSTSADAVRQMRQELRAQRQELEMRVAAAEARTVAIHEQIALARDQVQEEAKDDEIAENLKMAISLAKVEAAKMRELAKTKSVAEFDVNRAESEVARLQIELLRHQKSQVESGPAKQIAALNEQLTAVTIDMAESRKLLELTQERWEKTHQELAEQLLLEGKLQTIEAELAQRRVLVQHLQTQLRDVETAIQPRSTVRIVPWNE